MIAIIIAFVGHSGSGKSTLMNFLVNHVGFDLPTWITTRAPRDNDDDYNFLTVEQFLEQSKAAEWEEVGCNYGNLYATIYDDPISNDYATVTNVPAMASAKAIHGDNIVGIYVEVDEETRLARMLERGDSIEQAQERIVKDRVKFKNAFHVTDYKISSSSRESDIKELISILKDIEQEKGVKLLEI